MKKLIFIAFSIVFFAGVEANAFSLTREHDQNIHYYMGGPCPLGGCGPTAYTPTGYGCERPCATECERPCPVAECAPRPCPTPCATECPPPCPVACAPKCCPPRSGLLSCWLDRWMGCC